jgi:hypothetical protein
MNESSPPRQVFDLVARHPSGWEAVLAGWFGWFAREWIGSILKA